MPTKKTQRGVNERSARKIRRENVIARLEAQLKSGFKPFSNKREEFSDKDVAFDRFGLVDGMYLTAKDKERIKKELEVLRSRV